MRSKWAYILIVLFLVALASVAKADQSEVTEAERLFARQVLPPKENDRLSGDEIEAFRKWIVGGAPWAVEAKRVEIIAANKWDFSDGVTVQTVFFLNQKANP